MASKYKRGQQIQTSLGLVEVTNIERRIHGNSSWITIVLLGNGSKVEMRMSTSKLTKLAKAAAK